ncbi:acylphosphatase [uncultured Phycicoccus sp.]|uniref:acylphosphatase n=1 Tax=uncultured Phycicoccus sp. TaxID=661422 RepID=UPI0026196DB9|nr:acylphosphatase [uncultured Phycicoccus sp.]
MSTDDARGRPGPADPAPVRCTVFVRGLVQGVGFRWWTRARALELGLAGWARNTADGRVEVVAEGPRAAVERLVGLLREDPPEASSWSAAGRPGRVTSVSAPLWAEAKGESGFRER